MVQQLTPLKELNAVEQAVYFHSRERRRSLAGVAELFRTSRIFGTTQMAVAAFDPTAFFPNATLRPITFKTAIRIADNANARSGVILDLGNTSGGTHWALTNTTITVLSGGVGTDQVSLTFDNVAQFPATLELELVLSIIPGTGQARLWGNGREIARAVSGDGDLGSVGWLSGTDGSFAAAANGTVPSGASTGAPTEFAIIEPLSVFVGQKPRQFV